MALSSAMKKDAGAAKALAERQLKALEAKLLQNPSTALLKRIVQTRTTLRDLALGKV